jgi:hypothetical protein
MTAPETQPQEPTARRVWRDAVAAVAEKARAALPDADARIEAAVRLVLAGDVELLPEGTAKVASQRQGAITYHLVNGHCDCKATAMHQDPGFQCTHRLAYGIAKRATSLAREQMQALDTATDTTPAATVPLAALGASIPSQFIVELHGKEFVQYAGLLAMAHERGLQRLNARFISVTGELALAEATAAFADGRTFSECADATPANVGAKVKAHFARMALTRAKARALRDALNIAMCAVEEVEA